MKNRKTVVSLFRSRGFRYVTVVLLSPAGLAISSAQIGSSDDDIFELSPFEVSPTGDEGYRARNTLAGSRISTSLKDVAASISVVTKEFMQDVSAKDINDVLVYTGNTEGTANFTDAPAAGIGGFEDRTSNNPAGANRVRGLGAATLTRDYFVTIGNRIGFDSYNIDRLDISRGPNSILFGLGNPAGVVNYSPIKAVVSEDMYEVSARYGSFDDIRATFDVNKVIIQDKLAVRLAGLYGDRGFSQKPAWFEDERLFFTATYRPFQTTTLNFSYEVADQSQNNPNSITPTDHVTPWLAAGSPTWNAQTGVWSERPDGFGNVTEGGTGFAVRTAPNGSAESIFQEGSGERRFATYFAPGNPDVDIFTRLGVTNNNIVPLHKMNLTPTRNDYELETLFLNWEQKLAENLFLAVSHINEEVDNSSLHNTRSNELGILVDVTSVLPNGAANPHFGETFMLARTLDTKSVGSSSNESTRATLTYSLNTQSDSKWFGRHDFTVFGEKQKTEGWNNVFNEIQESNPFLNPNDRINAGAWQFTRLRYLGGTASSPATRAPVGPETEFSGVTGTFFNPNSGQWESRAISSTFAHKRRDVRENIVKSTAQVWQSSWLEGRLKATLGWRQDENRERSKASTSIGSDGFLVVDDTLPDFAKVSGNTTTKGVTAHPLPWLSFHYNESENFRPLAGDVDIFGDPIAPPTGEGKDYGFSLELLEGKLAMRFNWYELAEKNSRITNSGPDIAAQWELPWFDQVVAPQLAAQMGLNHAAQMGYENGSSFTSRTWGDNAIEATADVVSKGFEWEATYNPTPNWRMIANASQQEAVRSNIAPGLTRWVQETLPTWETLPYWDGDVEFDAGWGFSGNLSEYINNFNARRILNTFKSEEGKPNPQVREWRVNFINNYTFTDGVLSGFNVGGALRWQSESAIGFPAILNENGDLIGLQLDKGFGAGSETDVDLWVGYARKIWKDSTEWSLQLNLRDAFESKGLTPIVANSDGTPAVFRIEQGRTWYLTSTFRW